MPEGVLKVAGGHGGAFQVDKGTTFALVDLEGQQAIDFVAFNADDLSEVVSSVETRRAVGSLYITTGSVLMSSLGRPMLEVVEDTIGTHDYTVPACDDSRFAVDFDAAGHRNCLHNMFESLKAYGIQTPLALPEPFNFFQNSPVVEDGRTAVVDPPSRPGDRVVLRALMNLVCSVSSCPQDIIPGNGLMPTSIEVRYSKGGA
jgi:uncharacterized protein YcgI (DUF1989 family)